MRAISYMDVDSLADGTVVRIVGIIDMLPANIALSLRQFYGAGPSFALAPDALVTVATAEDRRFLAHLSTEGWELILVEDEPDG